MKILDTEIEFDFFNVEQMEKFEKHSEITAKKINEIKPTSMKQSVFIKKVCSIVNECFTQIFGKEVSEKIFGGKEDFRLCIRAFKDLVKARIEQENAMGEEIDELQKEMSSVSIKYSPNRAARRSKK